MLLHPPPPFVGCNRNRLDTNTTTVGGGCGMGGLRKGCVYPWSLPRDGWPEGGGGGWEMDFREPP